MDAALKLTQMRIGGPLMEMMRDPEMDRLHPTMLHFFNQEPIRVEGIHSTMQKVFKDYVAFKYKKIPVEEYLSAEDRKRVTLRKNVILGKAQDNIIDDYGLNLSLSYVDRREYYENNTYSKDDIIIIGNPTQDPTELTFDFGIFNPYVRKTAFGFEARKIHNELIDWATKLVFVSKLFEEEGFELNTMRGEKLAASLKKVDLDTFAVIREVKNFIEIYSNEKMQDYLLGCKPDHANLIVNDLIGACDIHSRIEQILNKPESSTVAQGQKAIKNLNEERIKQVETHLQRFDGNKRKILKLIINKEVSDDVLLLAAQSSSSLDELYLKLSESGKTRSHANSESKLEALIMPQNLQAIPAREPMIIEQYSQYTAWLGTIGTKHRDIVEQRIEKISRHEKDGYSTWLRYNLKGVCETRFSLANGLRVYYTIRANKLVVLAGGSKDSQDADKRYLDRVIKQL